jgi:hypothetical protein
MDRQINATSSREHCSVIPHDILARRWGTSITTASNTIKNTLQRGLRYMEGPLNRRFRTRQEQLKTDI